MNVKNNERDFKGVWIPKEIWLDNNLTIMEKTFLVEIDSLDNCSGCFASNKYFSDFFGLSKQRCSQIINSLISKNYIKCSLERKGKEVVKRTLNVVKRFNTYQENDIKVSSKVDEGIKKINTGYQENAKDNNTYNNTYNKPCNNKESSRIHLLKSLIKDKFFEYGKKYKDNKNTDNYIIENIFKENISDVDVLKCLDNFFKYNYFFNDDGKEYNLNSFLANIGKCNNKPEEKKTKEDNQLDAILNSLVNK